MKVVANQAPKMGGKENLRIFLKGDASVADSLLSMDEGGRSISKGFRALVEEKYEGRFIPQFIYEPFGRVDLILQQLEQSGIPQELHDLGLGKDEFIQAQFRSALFESESDIVVLSIGAEVAYPLWKSRKHGYFVSAPLDGEGVWSAELRQAFQERFEVVGFPPIEDFKQTYTQLIKAIKARLDAHVIVFNASSFDPKDLTHRYRGVQDSLSQQIHRLNFALMQLSVSEGISIIDTDRVIAEHRGGAQTHISKPLHYSKEAHQALCGEFLRVLEDIGFFEARPLVMQVGNKGRK